MKPELSVVGIDLAKSISHSTELRGEARHCSAKAPGGEDLEIQEPILRGDFATFHFYPTLQTWPKHPLPQCGNNRLYSAWTCTRHRRAREAHEDAHTLLCIGSLFLNHNCMQISEAFSSPAGVRESDAARPPGVRPGTIQPLASSVRRL